MPSAENNPQTEPVNIFSPSDLDDIDSYHNKFKIAINVLDSATINLNKKINEIPFVGWWGKGKQKFLKLNGELQVIQKMFITLLEGIYLCDKFENMDLAIKHYVNLMMEERALAESNLDNEDKHLHHNNAAAMASYSFHTIVRCINIVELELKIYK